MDFAPTEQQEAIRREIIQLGRTALYDGARSRSSRRVRSPPVESLR